MRKYYLNKEDLKGTFMSNTNCPIARCLKRHGFPDVQVGTTRVHLYGYMHAETKILEGTGHMKNIFGFKNLFSAFDKFLLGRPYFLLNIKE